MFKHFRNIETAFKHIRLFVLVLIVACLAICCYTVAKSYEMASAAQERIYILAGDKAMEAFAADRKDNIPVEAKDHVKVFHHYFFTLDPDDKVIEANIGQALYLADGSAKKLYDDLKEGGYYTGIISGNISQQITADSIQLQLQNYPYYFRFYGVQKIIRPTSIVIRSLVTEGYLRNVSRSDNNSHGFLIERWRITENRDINITQR